MSTYPSWIADLHRPSRNGLNRARFCARNIAPGMELQLVPEPENRASPHAVAVMLGRHHLGYIPEQHGRIYRTLVKEGAVLRCTVERVERRGWFFRRAKFVGLQISVIESSARWNADDLSDRVTAPWSAESMLRNASADLAELPTRGPGWRAPHRRAEAQSTASIMRRAAPRAVAGGTGR